MPWTVYTFDSTILGDEGPEQGRDRELQENVVVVGTGQEDQEAGKGEGHEAENGADRVHVQGIEGVQEVQGGEDQEVETEDEAGLKVEKDEGIHNYMNFSGRYKTCIVFTEL